MHHHWTWHDRLLENSLRSFTSPGQDKDFNEQTDALAKAGTLHGESWTFHVLPTQPFSGSSNLPPARHWPRTPLPHCPITSVCCWWSPHPPICGSHTTNYGCTHFWSINSSHFHLRPSHFRRVQHAPLYQAHAASREGVLTYVPEPLTASKLVVPHGQRGMMLTHENDAPCAGHHGVKETYETLKQVRLGIL